MDPSLVSTLVGAGGNLLGSATNALFQGMSNRASRRWATREQEKQYTRNIEFWNMQNEYNSPQQVMQRNKQAGLNPHFGLLGNQPTAAGPIAPVDNAQGQFDAPEVGSGVSRAAEKIANYQLMERQKLENDGIRIQNEIATQDLFRKQFDTQIRGIDFANYEQTKGYQLDAAKADIEQKRASTAYTLSQKELNSVKNESDLLVAASQIALNRASSRLTDASVPKVQQEIKNLQADEKIKNLQRQMQELGVQPGSPTWVYMLGTVVKHLLGNY